MDELSFPKSRALIDAFPSLKRSKRLHSIVEARLGELLKGVYPDSYPVSEPGVIPGGRADLGCYFVDGRYAVFELFATVSQVAQDLRHLEQSEAQVKIAILTDQMLDGGKIYQEYHRKNPTGHFPIINVSEILVEDLEAIAKDRLKQYIESAFSKQERVGDGQRTPELRLKLYRLDGNRAYRDELAFYQESNPSFWSWNFGIALVNGAERTTARDIRITLRLWWGGGDELQKPPRFRAPRSSPGWCIHNEYLVSLRPAELLFRDANFTCFFGQPHEWDGFTLQLQEYWRGQLGLNYAISSAHPYTYSTHTLTLTIGS